MKTKAAQPVISEGQKISKTVGVNGKTHNLTLHMNLYTYPDFSFELIDKITNEKGIEVEGVWFWGTYGNNHRERLEFDTRKGPGYLTFLTVARWCNGRKKNGTKQLVDIVEKGSK